MTWGEVTVTWGEVTVTWGEVTVTPRSLSQTEQDMDPIPVDRMAVCGLPVALKAILDDS